VIGIAIIGSFSRADSERSSSSILSCSRSPSLLWF
jgi:hypothetical protein